MIAPRAERDYIENVMHPPVTYTSKVFSNRVRPFGIASEPVVGGPAGGGAGSGGNKDGGGSIETGDGDVATETVKKLKHPQLYKVLLHNDDYTTMEFVVLVLRSVFHHSESEAVNIMLHVHRRGVGVAGVFSYEIAETKAAKVMRMAREHEYPLRCSVEPER